MSQPDAASTNNNQLQRRVGAILEHLTPALTSATSSALTSSAATSSAQGSSSSATSDVLLLPGNSSPLRWNGWGFEDTGFQLTPSGDVQLSGHRYAFSGGIMPALRSWMEATTGIDIRQHTPSQTSPVVPPPIMNRPFLDEIANKYARISFADGERLFHAHGHTAQEVYQLRFGKYARVPDVVVWPRSHADVEAIVMSAYRHDAVIIPYGGGTTVSQALLCPTNEQRMIVSVDMHHMAAIKWINRNNMTACIEAGIIGKQLDAQLKAQGLVLGHEPDSAEFSTLGGWIATRASGMRKNKYGNIEDILVSVKMVTVNGTMTKSMDVPRMSTGPDIHQVILGSEGTLGVITEAVVKVRLPAPVTQYGSLIFPNFTLGVQCLQEIQRSGLIPVSIRLVDNMQFQFGQALKPDEHKWFIKITDKIKKYYVLNHLKFDVNLMCAATLLLEGTSNEVSRIEQSVYKIASKYGGIKGGSENGLRGYFLTYMIGYLRDFGFNYSFIGESFETSVSWENIIILCDHVKKSIINTAKLLGVSKEPFISCRVTQLYDSGVCVYFYFGFVWTGLLDPVSTFDQIEHAARDEILKHGGSLSHHHGVGKLRKSWMKQTIGDEGLRLLKGIKSSLDPKNIFANGNLIDL